MKAYPPSYHYHTLGSTSNFNSKGNIEPNLQQVCSDAIKNIEQLKEIEFDSFACCGISGLVVAPVLAVMMNKQLTVVRKTIDGHTGLYVEGLLNCRYMIIDDFICSGNTVRHIIKKIKEISPSSICVGAYLHRNQEFKCEDYINKIIL